MITVTDMCDYVWCPYQLYLKKVEKIRPPLTSKMLRGIIIHKIKEEIYNREQVLLRTSVNDSTLLQEIQKMLFNCELQCAKNILLKERKRLERYDIGMLELLGELKNDFHYDSIIKAARIKSMMKKNGLKRALELLFPEGKTEILLEDKELDLRGRIDRYEELEDMCIPIDYKSGSPRDAITDGQRVQLAAYAIMLEKAIKKKVPIGMIEYTQIGRSIPVVIDEECKRETIEILDKVKKIVYDKKRPEKKEGEKCKYCSFKQYCI